MPHISALSKRFDSLPRNYRVVPTEDGFSLEVLEPARLRWVDVYDGLSVDGCLRAYEQLSDGERPSLETCEADDAL